MGQDHLSAEESYQRNLSLVEKILDECKRYGITAVIATDSFPTDDMKCSDKRPPEYWNNPDA